MQNRSRILSDKGRPLGCEFKHAGNRKTGNIASYISTDFEYPVIVTKHLFKSITSRLCTNSKNENIFERA